MRLMKQATCFGDLSLYGKQTWCSASVGWFCTCEAPEKPTKTLFWRNRWLLKKNFFYILLILVVMFIRSHNSGLIWQLYKTSHLWRYTFVAPLVLKWFIFYVQYIQINEAGTAIFSSACLSCGRAIKYLSFSIVAEIKSELTCRCPV